MTSFLGPVVLTGRQFVRLEPLTNADVAELAAAAADGDLGRLWFTIAPSPDMAEDRTHFFNTVSRAAIERLGAKLDGILRSHQVLPDGSRRDTVVYSILDIEWPAVRNNLEFRLGRR